MFKAAAGEPIPLYGDGLNVRDWLYGDDHVEEQLLAAMRGWIDLRQIVKRVGKAINAK